MRSEQQGGGSVDKGADLMYKTMKQLENSSIMAIQETRTLPAPFIETLGEDYAKQLTRLTADPIDTSKFAPQVAAQDVLQTQAATKAAAGIGAFQPFVTEAQRLAGMDPTTQQVTAEGITAAQTPFLSPFQQQVIDTTLAEFDRQRGMREQQIGDAAVRAGASKTRSSRIRFYGSVRSRQSSITSTITTNRISTSRSC